MVRLRALPRKEQFERVLRPAPVAAVSKAAAKSAARSAAKAAAKAPAQSAAETADGAAKAAGPAAKAAATKAEARRVSLHTTGLLAEHDVVNFYMLHR